MSKIKNFLVAGLAIAFVLGFFVWSIFLPDAEISKTERRKLAKFPKISAESVSSGTFMKDFESYSLDHFPLRDSFRTLKALTSFYAMGQKDNNDYYCYDGYLVKMEYPMNKDSVSYATSRFQFIYDTFLKDKDMKIYTSLIPDKNSLVPKDAGYLSINFEAFADTLREQMEYAEYIDIFPLLELSDYYATDTHWRQEKIVNVARHLASAMGVTLKGEYTSEKADVPFYGVYHGQAALPVEADSLYFLTNSILEGCTVKDLETNTIIPVYDMDKLTSHSESKIPDPYEMFLSGPNRSILEIHNPDATTDKELIIFRDSYANALAPLLVEGYQKITLIDIRRAAPAYLGNLVEFKDQDVLFLQSTLVLNDSSEIK
ncbi:MAG: hypothetical protein IJA62_01125 [Ruminococcus sp.]|nr:hypothetical protein [Ruminococcus sp.]